MLEATVASRALTDFVFIHVPKTGGTTLRKIIERELEPDELFEMYDASAEEAFARYAALDAASRERVRVYSGHVPFGVHERLRPGSRYVTMLREPVARVCSLYCHQSSIPSNALYDRIRDERMGLVEFVRDLGTNEADNFQTRMLSGARGVPFGECSREMLETAIRNVERHFSLALLTERFDDSVLLLRRMYGWKTPCYVRENISKRRIDPVAISDEAAELIRRQNALDLELYLHCEARFDELVDAQGPGFRRERAQFRALNRYAPSWLQPEVVWPEIETA